MDQRMPGSESISAAGWRRRRAPRLDARRGARAFRAAVSGADISRAKHPSPALRSMRGADFHAAVDQDRRLSGGLRLLPAERALRDRRERRKADATRRRGRARRAPPRARARAASAWARPGASRRIAISTRSATWSRACKALGLETCATLGMLTRAQARRLKAAGLDYYNHNLDTSPEYYGAIITTRTYQDRLDTLDAGARCRHPRLLRRHRRHGRDARGSRRPDRDARQPARASGKRADQHAGPGRGHAARRRRSPLDPIDFVRTIAVARITMPKSVVRLSAGREDMSDETQALCFLAGANSIFYGPKLLTTANPGARPRPEPAEQARARADGEDGTLGSPVPPAPGRYPTSSGRPRFPPVLAS